MRKTAHGVLVCIHICSCCIGWLRGDTSMNPCELTAAITALANSIACNRTVDELNLLGVIFTQLGDTLITIGTQKSICGNK